ncbi:uncharacterized protein LOC129946963 [Eupeodes corollae]|uniref:uncharacterized protein LOC129946963 n=1 Tax=Eupeodes corollae TaxID=290404 RepID=UPI002492BB9B|nr:uncharacterized protein LOC129946963 [Eupeodes corollae]
MSPTRWNRKRLTIIGISLLVIYILFTSGYHNYQIDTLIHDSRPEYVWEYVADFRNMRSLNPTILDFEITSDEGNSGHWKYSVEYHENLSHWPYWKSVAYGDYSVIKPLPGHGDAYLIKSNHKTCFFGGLYCLRSESEFKFSALGKDTYCVEKVTFQCPPFLSSVCRRELEFQRKAVMNNLSIFFTKSRSN